MFKKEASMLVLQKSEWMRDYPVGSTVGSASGSPERAQPQSHRNRHNELSSKNEAISMGHEGFRKMTGARAHSEIAGGDAPPSLYPLLRCTSPREHQYTCRPVNHLCPGAWALADHQPLAKKDLTACCHIAIRFTLFRCSIVVFTQKL